MNAVSLPEKWAEFIGNKGLAPEFPLDVLGNARAWVETAAKQTSTKPDYVACSLLAFASATIGNARWPNPRAGWAEPPHLWIGLVGKSSSRKSSALSAARAPLQQLERRALDDQEQAYKRWEAEVAIAKEAESVWQAEVKKAVKDGRTPPNKPNNAELPVVPVGQRLILSDATTEAMAMHLANAPRGACVLRDELAGWVQSFNAYKAASGADRAFWLEANGGRSFTVDRVKHGGRPLYIPYLSCAVVGTIQPDRLNPILSDVNDGFAARFLWTCPDRLPPKREAVPSSTIPEQEFGWLRSLEMDEREDGSPCPRKVQFSEDAQDVLFDVEQAVHEMTENESGVFEAHIGKYTGFSIRLALVLEYLWTAFDRRCEQAVVTVEAMQAARRLMFDYFLPMSRFCYDEAALSTEKALARKIAIYIQKNKAEIEANGGIINQRSLHRDHFRSFSSNEINGALGVLEKSGLLLSQNMNTGIGRPSVGWAVR